MLHLHIFIIWEVWKNMPKKSVYYQVDRIIFFWKIAKMMKHGILQCLANMSWILLPQSYWGMIWCRLGVVSYFGTPESAPVYPYVLNQTAITWRKPHFETPLGIGHPAMTLGQRSFRKLKSWDRTWSKNNPGETFNPSKSNYRRKVLNIMKHVGLPRNDDILVYPPNSGFNGAMMINHDKPFFELLGTSVFKINPIFAKPW